MKKVKRLPPPDIEDEPLPDDMLKQMQPARDVLPDILAGRKPLGRPRKSMPKKLVSLRIDADVLAAYRAIGEGWQTKINETLRNNVPKRLLARRGAGGRFVDVPTKSRTDTKRHAQGKR